MHNIPQTHVQTTHILTNIDGGWRFICKYSHKHCVVYSCCCLLSLLSWNLRSEISLIVINGQTGHRLRTGGITRHPGICKDDMFHIYIKKSHLNILHTHKHTVWIKSQWIYIQLTPTDWFNDKGTDSIRCFYTASYMLPCVLTLDVDVSISS